MDIVGYLDKSKAEVDKAIGKYIPREFTKEKAEFVFGKASYSYDTKALTESLSKPVWDLLDRGGKRWRPGLLLLVAEAFGLKPAGVVDFAALTEILHNGSLMVDDIEDSGETRRGKPCVHKLFGEDVAVNAGNFMYFIPSLVFIKNSGKFKPGVLLRAWEAYGQEMVNIHAGQGLDIWWHRGNGSPGEAEYLQMCAYKTGTLARLACRLGVILAGGTMEAEQALGKVGEAIGVAFQVKDDVLSASGGKFQEFKGYGDDVTEGKRTLIVIHALQHLDKKGSARLLEILGMHTRDKVLVAEALQLLAKQGSVEYAKKRARDVALQAWEKAKPLVPGSKAKGLLEGLVMFAVEREI